jgi:NitT/TauT family transport system ATP-binding protein
LLSPHPGQVKAEMNTLPRMGSTTQDAVALEQKIHDLLFSDVVEAQETADVH